MIALALSLALAVVAPAAAVDAGPGPSDAGAPALSLLCEEAAQRALADLPPGQMAGVYVEASTPELAHTAQSLLLDALVRRRVKAAVPIGATGFGEAEQAARKQGLDVLLRLRVGLEGLDLTLAGDRIGTWVNFWDGTTPQRQLPAVPLAVRARADGAALTLARVVLPVEQHPVALVPPPIHYGVDPLARIPAKVIALALIDADGDGRPELALLTPTEVLLTRADGEVLSRHDHAQLPEALHPSRDPTGGLVAIAGVAGHRLAYAYSGQARGESLTADKQGLHLLGLVDGTPLSAGQGGVVEAEAVDGTNLFGPGVKLGGAAHDLAHPVLALRANPGAGEPAFVAEGADGEAQPLSSALAPLGAPLEGVGEAAVADLDGDGVAEVVASSAAPAGASDQVRILRVGQAAPLYQSEPVAGAILASCAGDLDGDGKADVILAAWQPDGTTTLLRVGVKP